MNPCQSENILTIRSIVTQSTRSKPCVLQEMEQQKRMYGALQKKFSYLEEMLRQRDELIQVGRVSEILAPMHIDCCVLRYLFALVLCSGSDSHSSVISFSAAASRERCFHTLVVASFENCPCLFVANSICCETNTSLVIRVH